MLDGETKEFIAWDHGKSMKDGTGHRMMLLDNGAFAGTVFITETRESSFPEPVTSEIDLQYNVFGLINPLDYHRVYFCDWRGSQDQRI